MQACPNCGEDNQERAKFCSSCGTALAAAPPATAEERKVVSIVFADLVGFTAKSDTADPEDVRAALKPYHARLKREIERYGGTVEKFIGDAVMAVFGAPVAHEDDAERAVRAALRIIEEIPALNDEHPGLDLAVRVAVNTGEGLVSIGARPERGEALVAGDVVNTASRLQNVAPVGGVVVGEATYRATRDLFEYEPLPSVSLKGKAEPVPLWQAIHVRAGFGRGMERSDRTPFVGRKLEQSLLQQAFQRTVRERSAQLVTITGEPGVGKSRLVAEFFRFIDDQPDIVWWRQGRCLPYGEGVSFWALGEVVKAQAGILESDGPDDVAAKLESAVGLWIEEKDRDWIRSLLRPLVGLSVPERTDPGEAFAAWRTFLEAMAEARPLILVFEDLHWADDAKIDFVEHLVDWSTEVPILVVCTARPELYERNAGWGGGKRNAVTIALSPLTTDESDELVAALLGDRELPADVYRSLLDRAGGNPLYAEEFIRMVEERPSPNGNGHREMAVPDTVHALIAARLDTLAPPRKSLLYDASVVGRVFWAGAVAHIAGIPAGEVREGLHELSRKELVRGIRTSSVKDDVEYSFWHALVRDVAYGQIPRALRAEKHGAAAEWIERLAGERVADHAEVLVHHYREATNLARAASLDARSDEYQRRLRTYLVMAADKTVALAAKRAHAYYVEALELMPADDPERGSILAHAAKAAHAWGGLDAAEELIVEALEAFRASGEALAEADMILYLDDIQFLRGEPTKGILESALAILERAPPSALFARAQSTIGFRYVLAGDYEEGIRWLDKAVRVAEDLDDRELWMRILIQRGPTRVDRGDMGGLDDLRQALHLGLEEAILESSRPTQIVYNNLADTLWRAEGPTAAIPTYREGIEFGERRGLDQPAEWSQSELTRALYESGEWDEVLTIADAILGPASTLQRNSSAGIIFASASRARVLARRGRPTRDVSALLDRARGIGDNQMVQPALVVAAISLEMLGEPPDLVLALVEEYAERTDGIPLLRAYDLCEMVRIALRAGRSELATRLVDGVGSTTSRERCGAAGSRAALAEAGASPHEAARLYRDAAGEWDRFGNVVEQAFALLGEGRCLSAAGDRSAAKDALLGARTIFSRLEASPLTAEIDGLLAG